MHYYVTVVKDNPESILASLGAEHFAPAYFNHPVFDIVGYCHNIGGRVCVSDDEII